MDRFGRVATDLRISVTDRCNFRCRYCMPAEGVPWLPTSELLTFEETALVARVLIESGVRAVKLTGGEPLVRKDLENLVSMLRGIDAELDISLTTNGYLLGDRAEALAAAGLDRVAVSCDSLLRHRFRAITLRDAFDRVMKGLRAAARAGLAPVKVNCVVMRGVNDAEIPAFAELAREAGYEVRFIEFMPLDAQGAWRSVDVVPGAEILERIDRTHPLIAVDGMASQPATSYRFADGAKGRVGIIPSVTEPFCDSCDRLRLTADGQLRACLFSTDETDLRSLLRDGATDEALAAAARACVAAKEAGHRIGAPEFEAPARSMSMIGG